MYLRRKKRGFFQKILGFSGTVWIIAINIVVFLFLFTYAALYCSADTCFALDYLSLRPALILKRQFLWTLVTHMFSHLYPFHIFVNMFALFSLGSLCERIIGRKRFLWFYILSGVFAGILSVFLSGYFGYGKLVRVFGSPDNLMLGASGAIFAIAGLFVVLLPRLRFSIIFIPFISFPAYIIVPLVLFLMWFATILANLPIGNVAHFGGFIAGIAYGYYLKIKYKKKVMLLQRYFR